MAPIVSVIVPVYNGEKYIEKCVSSLVCQTYSNLEIIVVNDGSSDRTSTIVHDMQVRDSRIIVVDKINEGGSIARNTALAIAKGEWIAFSDADDYYYPNGIASLIEVAKKTCCKIVIGNSERVEKDGRRSQRYPTFKDETVHHDYLKGSHEMWGDLFHASLFDSDEYLFQPRLAYLEDRALMAKLLSREEKYAVCAKPIYAHVKNVDSVLESKDGLRMAKHCFWAASIMAEHSKKSRKFAIDIYRDAEYAKVRGCIFYFIKKNASFVELNNIYYSYFDKSLHFYKYVLQALYEIWMQCVKRRVKSVFYRQ